MDDLRLLNGSVVVPEYKKLHFVSFQAEEMMNMFGYIFLGFYNFLLTAFISIHSFLNGSIERYSKAGSWQAASGIPHARICLLQIIFFDYYNFFQNHKYLRYIPQNTYMRITLHTQPLRHQLLSLQS
jgi:hypothetical protein